MLPTDWLAGQFRDGNHLTGPSGALGDSRAPRGSSPSPRC